MDGLYDVQRSEQTCHNSLAFIAQQVLAMRSQRWKKGAEMLEAAKREGRKTFPRVIDQSSLRRDQGTRSTATECTSTQQE